MCTLRGVWILKEHATGADVVFSKRINTVEVRVRLMSGSNYIAVPNDNDLLRHFCLEVIRGTSNTTTTTTASSSNTTTATPASQSPHKIYQSTPNTHVVALQQDRLWPIVYLKKKNYYFITIPVIEEYLASGGAVRPSLVELPQITASVCFLEEVAFFSSTFLTKPPPYPELQSMIKSGFPPNETFNPRRPAWKPFVHKGKQQLDFIISETIQAVQYDSPATTDSCKVFGALFCKADLEGMPEVSAYLTTPPETSPAKITHMAIDSSVQTTSDIMVTGKVTFTPPLDTFKVLAYGVDGVATFPLRGFYQMKQMPGNVVKLLVQLKLNADMTNNFEYCVMRLPFKNRGNIILVNASPTTGTIHIDPSLRALVWNIGQKFSGRNLEVALPAEVTFSSAPPNAPPQPPTLSVTGSSGNQSYSGFPTQTFPMTETDGDDERDPFCQGPNTYVKILHCTLSGFNVDGKKVAIYPASKSKINVDKEIVSSDYVIWNSLGSSKSSYQPTPEESEIK
eukprot:gene7976-9371_t